MLTSRKRINTLSIVAKNKLRYATIALVSLSILVLGGGALFLANRSSTPVYALSPGSGGVNGGNLMTLDGFTTFNNRYIQVEYINFDGNQYIDTGITPNDPTLSVNADWVYTDLGTTPSIYKTLFGSRDTPTAASQRMTFTAFNGGALYMQYGQQDFTTAASLLTTNTRYQLVFTNKHATVSSGATTLYSYDFSTATTPSTAPTMYVGDMNQGGVPALNMGFVGRLYSFKLGQGGVLVRDYVPAYDTQTRTWGLYDKVGGKFYNKTGTTTGMITGPTIGINFNMNGQNWPCPQITPVSPTEITCLVPPSVFGGNGTGTATVSIYQFAAGIGTLEQTLGTTTYNYVAANITSISPKNGSIDGGTEITISGTNFCSGATFTDGVNRYCTLSGGGLVFNGTQYINTGIDPSGQTLAQAIYRFSAPNTSAYFANGVFGAANNSATVGLNIFGFRKYGGSWRMDYSDNTHSGAALEYATGGTYDTGLHTAEVTGATLSTGNYARTWVDYNLLITSQTGSGSTPPGYNLYIGATETVNPAVGGNPPVLGWSMVGTIYSMQVNQPSKIYNFVPVCNIATGEAGMFDRTNNVFYGATSPTKFSCTKPSVVLDYEGTPAVCNITSYSDTEVKCTTSAHVAGWVSLRLNTGTETMTVARAINQNVNPGDDNNQAYHYDYLNLSLSANAVQINVDLGTGNLDSGSVDVDVASNVESNYTVSVRSWDPVSQTSPSNSTQLQCVVSSCGSSYYAPIAATGLLATNSWGWNGGLAAAYPTAPATWQPMTTSDQTLATGSGDLNGNPFTDNYKLWFGVNTNYSQPGGSYESNVLITAVAVP